MGVASVGGGVQRKQGSGGPKKVAGFVSCPAILYSPFQSWQISRSVIYWGIIKEVGDDE
jgi:hypothetical protein